MSVYGVNKLCHAALHDLRLREKLKHDPVAALQEFPLTEDEKQSLMNGNLAKLWEAGASGYLLAHLPRWELFGLTLELYSERIRTARDWRYPEGLSGVTSGREGHVDLFR